jgi:DNA-binding MarR family transcriptional regulator
MTDWLDETEMRAWRGFIELSGMVQAELEHDLLTQHGLSAGDYGVLVNLSEAPDRRLRMCDLAHLLHLSPSGLTRRLDGLVKGGFVERQPAPDDRRAILAVLTDAGMAKLQAAAPDHVDSVRRHLLDRLSRTQITQLGTIMATASRRRSAIDDD